MRTASGGVQVSSLNPKRLLLAAKRAHVTRENPQAKRSCGPSVMAVPVRPNVRAELPAEACAVSPD
jgi:hypothetical protein